LITLDSPANNIQYVEADAAECHCPENSIGGDELITARSGLLGRLYLFHSEAVREDLCSFMIRVFLAVTGILGLAVMEHNNGLLLPSGLSPAIIRFKI
jgi:hypothetical protein